MKWPDHEGKLFESEKNNQVIWKKTVELIASFSLFYISGPSGLVVEARSLDPMVAGSILAAGTQTFLYFSSK